MPGLYFLSTGAEISNITNLKTFGFQQGPDMLEPDFAQVWGKRTQESKRYFNRREVRAKIRANDVQLNPRGSLKIETVF